MVTNDLIRREHRNDCEDEDKDSRQIEGVTRYHSKADMLFCSLDGPLTNILQGGLQETITVGGNMGEKVGALDMEVSAKDGGVWLSDQGSILHI